MKVQLKNRRKYFFAAVAVLLVVGFLVTTLVSHYVARSSLQRQVAQQMLPLTSDNIYSEIQRDLLRPILISSLMAHDTFVRDWALSGEKDPERIATYLAEIQRKYSAITSFFVSDATLNYYHSSGLVRKMEKSAAEDGWYFRLRHFSEDYDINVDEDTVDRSRLNIFINYRVFNYQGDFIGVTGIGLSVESVIDLINNYQRRYNRKIYFVDREGEVRLHGGQFDLNENLFARPGLENITTRLLTSPSVRTSYTGDDGVEVYINSRLVPEFDWFLIVEQRGDIGREILDRALWFNILLALGITVVVLLVAHLTLRGYQNRLVEMATVDKLTGALNRHAFENLFAHVIKVNVRQRRPVSLVAMDLDHFKAINDRYGHQAGDTVLKNVVKTIESTIRESDTLCRWGGEEFMVLLEDCPFDQALTTAEKIRCEVSARTFTFGKEHLSVTISLGVARYRQGEPMEECLSRADMALYAAKQQGRDRVMPEQG